MADSDVKLLEETFGIDVNEYEDPYIWDRMKELEKEQREKTHLFMNKENGNLLTYSEMLTEAEELYDIGDPTNPIGWEEYYTEVEA